MNYENIHNNLIKRARVRHTHTSVFYERHHVVPRCLGGDDSTSNIVKLTPKEHRLAHKLLTKLHPGHLGLIFAANMMYVGRSGVSPNWLRAKVSEQLRRVWSNPDTRRLRMDSIYKSWESQERRVANGKRMRDHWSNPDNRKNHSVILKNATSDSEFRAARSAVSKLAHNRPEVVEKHRENTSGYWKNNPLANARRQALKDRLTKLSEVQVAEIVRLYKIEGWTQQQLADKFNVSRSCIQTKVKSS